MVAGQMGEPKSSMLQEVPSIHPYIVGEVMGWEEAENRSDYDLGYFQVIEYELEERDIGFLYREGVRITKVKVESRRGETVEEDMTGYLEQEVRPILEELERKNERLSAISAQARTE